MDKPAGHIVAMSDGKQTVSGPDGENESRGAIPRREGAAELSLPISIDAFGTEYGTIDIDGERTPSANRRAHGADSRDSRAVARDRFARQGNAQLRARQRAGPPARGSHRRSPSFRAVPPARTRSAHRAMTASARAHASRALVDR